jgi:hypothetical protein
MRGPIWPGTYWGDLQTKVVAGFKLTGTALSGHFPKPVLLSCHHRSVRFNRLMPVTCPCTTAAFRSSGGIIPTSCVWE